MNAPLKVKDVNAPLKVKDANGLLKAKDANAPRIVMKKPRATDCITLAV